MTEAQKSRSPEQLAILAQARIKAQAVRSENAKLKSQERELAKLEKDKEKENRKKNVTDRMAKLKGTPEPEEGSIEEEAIEEEAEPAPKPIKKTKKKPKQKIVEVSDSEDSEEEEIVYIKKAKPKRVVYREERPVPVEPPKPVYRHIRAEHADLYKRMFTI
jgi:hypothetical protein